MLNKKHVLSAAVAGVAGLLIASSASAAGVSLGGQLGWGTTHQSGFSQTSINSALAGIGSYNYTNKNTNDGLAGRIFAGYDVNQTFGVELGYTKFSNSTATFAGTAASTPFNVKTTIKTYAVDLVGKATMPLEYGFSLTGKLGAAYLNESGAGSLNGSTLVKHTEGKIYPTFGAGVGYDINKSLTTDVSWMRIQKVGNNSYLKSTDFVGLGLSYHFS